jgi:hypothetical protein
VKRARLGVVSALRASSKQHFAKPSNCSAKLALMTHNNPVYSEKFRFATEVNAAPKGRRHCTRSRSVADACTYPGTASRPRTRPPCRRSPEAGTEQAEHMRLAVREERALNSGTRRPHQGPGIAMIQVRGKSRFGQCYALGELIGETATRPGWDRIRQQKSRLMPRRSTGIEAQGLARG